MEYLLEVYETKNGRIPFDEWINGLDSSVRQRIRMRITRLSLCNFSNCDPIGEGASEAKLDFGPGYRIYFILIGTNKILILFGGTKRKQSKDVEKAKEFLKDFKINNMSKRYIQ